MKRKIFKDIIIAVIPILTFFEYSFFEQRLTYYAASHYSYTALISYRLFAPMLIGAVVCGALIYAWCNRASTVFICLFCGAFLTNLFFALSQTGLLDGMTYYSVTKGASGVGLAAVVDGTYATMFFVSLVSFIKSKKKN